MYGSLPKTEKFTDKSIRLFYESLPKTGFQRTEAIEVGKKLKIEKRTSCLCWCRHQQIILKYINIFYFSDSLTNRYSNTLIISFLSS